jgi:pyruvate/2-oxoglutarate dehydrogenase complex dihydrolipoamide acyltransferase (E2) component
MSIELAEKLKEKLTDKYVVVDKSIPELRRFAEWTGKVKTVNMSCRALVEFDGPVDIGWYDINPDYLIVVDGPRPKAAPAAKAPAAKPAGAEAKPAPAAAAKPAAATGKSPLDAIRAQQAAKAAGAPAAAPAASGAKISPLDMIRKQQAAKAKPEAAADVAPPAAEAVAVAAAPEPAPAAPTPKPPVPTTGPDGRPLSKIEMIRMQGAKKS